MTTDANKAGRLEAISQNLVAHPDWAGDLNRCAACGRELAEDEERAIVVLGEKSGEHILITRVCLDGCSS